MGGETIYCGKPHPPIYALARRRLADMGLRNPRILCIGDGINTDVKGAANEGLAGCFVTGGLAAGEFGEDPAHPDPALLNAWLARHGANPVLSIPALA